MNFFDPRWTSEHKPYGPERFKQIIKERYLISTHLNTDYVNTASISPTERKMLLQFIKEDLQRKHEMMEQMKNKKK